MIQGKSRSVLVVDDVDVERMLVCEMLRKGLGVQCVEAKDGNAALAILNSNDGDSIDLVLLDLFMPGMDGMEVLNAIKASHPWMPVVILTGSKSIDHAVRTIRSGAVNFLMKPVQEDRLVTSVQNAIDIGMMRREIDALRDKLGVRQDDEPLGLSMSLCDMSGELKTMNDLEVEIAAKVLEYCRGNVSKASKALGLARSTFYRKLDSAQE